MYKYAIIGNGFIFPRHKQAIADVGSKIVLTCDIDKSKGADFTDYRDMLESDRMKEIDAVVVCTPNHLHAEIIRDSLRAGKKVLCEKPLTITTDFSGLDGVGVVHQLRFHPLFKEMSKKLKNARYVKAVLKAYRDQQFWDSWKGNEMQSGGVVYVLGSHIFDLLVSILGNDVIVISAEDSMRKSKGILSIDRTIVDFEFEFLNSRDGQTRHLEIDGEKYILSLKDNLSFEGLHDKVYKAFEAENMPSFEDVKNQIELINKIKSIG